MHVLERDADLERLNAAAHAAARGTGRLVLVSGEAGMGKTTLLRQFATDGAHDGDVFTGLCDPISTPRPLGPLFDVAFDIDRELHRMLRDGADRDAIFRTTLDRVRSRDRLAVLTVEDLHWADEATLDLLRFVARRLEGCCLLILASYRPDEVGADHPLRRLLAHLATLRGVERLALEPLSMEAVARLAEGRGVEPAELHARTGGNPFFVSEVLANGTDRVPASVRDVLLAQLAGLSDDARAAIEAAALIGNLVEPWLLEAVLEGRMGGIDECFDRRLLHAEGTRIAFRHELGREAVVETVAPHRRVALHSAVVRVLRDTPTMSGADGLARLAHHAEAAGEAEIVLEVAPEAAGYAARLHAHREARAQYERALRFDPGNDPARRARLLEALAYECYLTGDVDAAIRAMDEALALHGPHGTAEDQGRCLRWLGRLHWFAGRGRESIAATEASIELLESLPPGHELAWAYSYRSQLAMLHGDVAATVRWGELARGLARQVGSVEIEAHATNNIGTARYCCGVDEGRAQLEASLAVAYEHGLGEHVARAYTNLASNAVALRQLDRAERDLADGIAYAAERDLDAWRHYMLGWRALADLYRGAWDEALRTVLPLDEAPDVAPISRVIPWSVRATVLVRTGSSDAAVVRDLLADALEVAERTAELQRLVHVAVAMAEAADHGYDVPEPHALLRRCYELAAEADRSWWMGELAYWMRELGDPAPGADALSNPYGRMLQGDACGAAAAWTELGLPYEAARARAASDDEAELHRAHAAFRRLGATAMAGRVERKIERLGLRPPARGPRPETRANPAQLTRRQLQVLELMAVGLANAEIAARLHRSPRTVEHHVSAVLAKLEVQNRTEAVRRALDEGWIATDVGT